MDSLLGLLPTEGHAGMRSHDTVVVIELKIFHCWSINSGNDGASSRYTRKSNKDSDILTDLSS